MESGNARRELALCYRPLPPPSPGGAFFTGRALSTKSTALAQTTKRGQTRPPAAGWVVVGKLARALAGPLRCNGAVHKAVEFVDKAGVMVSMAFSFHE